MEMEMSDLKSAGALSARSFAQKCARRVRRAVSPEVGIDRNVREIDAMGQRRCRRCEQPDRLDDGRRCRRQAQIHVVIRPVGERLAVIVTGWLLELEEEPVDVRVSTTMRGVRVTGSMAVVMRDAIVVTVGLTPRRMLVGDRLPRRACGENEGAGQEKPACSMVWGSPHAYALKQDLHRRIAIRSILGKSNPRQNCGRRTESDTR
jgi:hypothetical protein